MEPGRVGRSLGRFVGWFIRPVRAKRNSPSSRIDPLPLHTTAIERASAAPAQAPTLAAPAPAIVPGSNPVLRGVMFDEDDHLIFTNERFEEVIAEAYRDRIEHSFYTTIAGVSHRNDDRTSRRSAICKCDELDEIFLVHDVENKFSKHAIKVLTRNGQQLGFLPDRTAADVLRRAANDGQVAVRFRHHNHHPDTGEIVGGTILILYLRPASEAGLRSSAVEVV